MLDTVEFYGEILLKNGIHDKISHVTEKTPEDLAGEQFASQCKEVAVTFVKEDVPRLHLFVKTTTTNTNYAEEMKQVLMFDKESEFFSSIIPDFEEYSKKSGWAPHLKRILPKCYHSAGDMLIFENLRYNGYTKLSRFQPHDLHTAKLVIQNLATLHASLRSYMQSFGDEESFAKKYSNTASRSIWLEEGELINGTWIQQVVDGAIQILTQNPSPGFEEVLQFFNTYKTKAFLKICHLFYPDNKRCSTTVVHGDCWNGNMMFKLEDTKTPQQCAFIDFQTVALATPALDLIMYIFFVVDSRVRIEHWKTLLAYYYNLVEELLLGYGHKIAYNLEDLIYDFTTKSIPGFFYAMYHIFGFEALEKVPDVHNGEGDVLQQLCSAMSASLDRLMKSRGAEFSKLIVLAYNEFMEIAADCPGKVE